MRHRIGRYLESEVEKFSLLEHASDKASLNRRVHGFARQCQYHVSHIVLQQPARAVPSIVEMDAWLSMSVLGEVGDAQFEHGGSRVLEPVEPIALWTQAVAWQVIGVTSPVRFERIRVDEYRGPSRRLDFNHELHVDVVLVCRVRAAEAPLDRGERATTAPHAAAAGIVARIGLPHIQAVVEK
jgi:hypothetical protein